MHLDREQERALDGERGPGQEWAMRVLVDLGDRTGSPRLVPVTSVHIPGWCGGGSPEAWSSLRSVTNNVAFPVTANPGGAGDATTLEREEALGSLRPHGTYSFSCAPYLSGNHPGRGEVVAWGGRAASAFANSVLGAKSEVEEFETAVASAVTGLTPERRMHVDENRRPSVAVVAPEGVDLTALGWALSRQLGGEVPLLCGVGPGFDEAKRLAFAINSRGTVPLFRMQRAPAPPAGVDVMEVEHPLVTTDPAPEADLVVVGCPHLSEQDINRWSTRLVGRRPSGVEAWFFTSRLCSDKCPRSGAVLRSRGLVFVDGCPLGVKEAVRGRTVACDSPEMADCLRGAGASAYYVSEQDLLKLLTF